MPNVNAVLAMEINRLSKRVVNQTTKVTRRLVTQHRRDLAALKRQVSALMKTVSELQKQEQKRSNQLPVPENVEGLRFRADGLKTHRARLGLSAKEYGQLVGVSSLTIYNWEAKKSKPRAMQLPKIAAVRNLGKREAMQRLGLSGSTNPPIGGTAKAPAAGKRKKRGQFAQTAEEMILGLLKGRRGLTTKRLAGAWKKSGRAGTVDNTLSLMVAGKKLKRKPLGGKKGSEYRMR